MNDREIVSEARIDNAEPTMLSVNVNQVNGHGFDTLNQAITNGNIERLKILLESGANVSQPDAHGVPPLIDAISSGSNEVARILIEFGANVNQGADGFSPLSVAIFKGNIAIVTILIMGGANVNEVDKLGRTPLMYAIEMGRSFIVEVLVKCGANVNPDADGLSALSVAIKLHSVYAIRILIDAGANVNLNQGADGPSPLSLAITSRSAGIVRMLVNAGANVNQVDGDTSSPLRNAIFDGGGTIAKILIMGGANVNEVDKLGGTHLIYAIQRREIRMVEALVELGANVNQCADGLSPLSLAIRIQSADIVKTLVDAGADINGLNIDKFFGCWVPAYIASKFPDWYIDAEVLSHLGTKGACNGLSKTKFLIAEAVLRVGMFLYGFSGLVFLGRPWHGWILINNFGGTQLEVGAASVIATSLYQPETYIWYWHMARITGHSVNQLRSIFIGIMQMHQGPLMYYVRVFIANSVSLILIFDSIFFSQCVYHLHVGLRWLADNFQKVLPVYFANTAERQPSETALPDYSGEESAIEAIKTDGQVDIADIPHIDTRN